jgi:hypothetical protein
VYKSYAVHLGDTDASNNGIGAVLSQVQEGEERVIEYYSKIAVKPGKKLLRYNKEVAGDRKRGGTFP